MTTRPFYRPDPAWWPTIAEVLPKPWPAEAVEHDLVWWLDQIEVGRVDRLPGRPTLAVRWGWTERKVRGVLEDVQRTSSRRPAHVQPTSSTVTVQAPLSADNVQPASSERPANVQRTSSDFAPVCAEESASNADEAGAPRARGTEPEPEPYTDPRTTNTREPDPDPTPAPTPAPKPVEPEPVAQLGLLPTPPKPGPEPPSKPKRSKDKPPKPDPEQDPTWSAFAALAVETGLVDAPPKPDARAPSRKVSRAAVIAEYVAEHGAERVLAVWRWVLTSPGRSATWWREARVEGELIGSFLRPSNFQTMADSFDVERKHGVKLEVVRGGRGTFGRLPTIEESEYRHEQALAWRELAWRELAATPNPPEEEIDDALCW